MNPKSVTIITGRPISHRTAAEKKITHYKTEVIAKSILPALFLESKVASKPYTSIKLIRALNFRLKQAKFLLLVYLNFITLNLLIKNE